MKRNRLFSFPFFLVLVVTSIGIAPSYAQGGGSTHDALIARIPTLENFKDQADRTFVGEVDHSYAYIAFVVQGNLAVIYVCDGVGVSGWIKAEVVNGAIQVTDEKSGVEINATVAAEAINGTIKLATDDDGTEIVAHTFKTAPAIPGKTGLARHVDDSSVSGWIVTEHGIHGIRKILDCRVYKKQVETLRNLYNMTSDAAVRSEIANQYTVAALDATNAGCGDVTT